MADTTHVSTWSGGVYVVFVIDAYARRIIGWRCGSSVVAASVGAVGSSCDNVLAETINGLYKTEVIKPRGP